MKGEKVGVVRPLRTSGIVVVSGSGNIDDVVTVKDPVDVLKGVELRIWMIEKFLVHNPRTQVFRGAYAEVVAIGRRVLGNVLDVDQ